MSKETKTELEIMIDVLHAEAAEALAWKAEVEANYPWRRHDARIYAERADAALRAVQHLTNELEAVA